MPALVCLAISGCGRPDVVTVEASAIVEGREPLVVRPAMEVLGLRRPTREVGPTDFDYELPAEWRALPITASGMRRVDLRFGAEADPAQCYLIRLEGGGGTVADNVNRWRGQCALAPLDATAIAALPRRRLEGLGVEATVVDLRGSYTGMTGGTKEGQRFIGWIWYQGDAGYYLVCVGDEAVVDAAHASFERFAATLRGSAPSPGAAQGAGSGGSSPGEGADPLETLRALIDFDLPSGWTRAKDRPMRILNFQVDASGTTCYLSEAGGTVLDNTNRWLDQLGLARIDKAGLAALPRVSVFGNDAVLVEGKGKFAGGMGAAPIEDAMLLGAIAARDTSSLFVKLLGPREVVEAQREAFLAFCKSLRPKAGAQGGGK